MDKGEERMDLETMMAERAKAFFESYSKLVEESGFHMEAVPGLSSSGDGHYSIVVGIGVIASNDGRYRFPIKQMPGRGSEA